MAPPSPDAHDAWHRFARELATMDTVVARLLGEHVRTDTGHCARCTRPGRGTPMLVWPCPLWTLARTAQSIRGSRQHGEGGP
ncbi:MAG TPA: hypothetical protein VEZ42_03745 [Pseudonocardia sp.]|nr:hypothetical protein [Pseudonocardia sp.]